MKISILYDSQKLSIKQVIQKCVFLFPYIWASIIKFQLVVDAWSYFIVTQLLVCKDQLSLMISQLSWQYWVCS